MQKPCAGDGFLQLGDAEQVPPDAGARRADHGLDPSQIDAYRARCCGDPAVVPGPEPRRGEDWDVDDERELPFAARLVMLGVLGVILGVFIILGVMLGLAGSGVSPG